MTQPSKSALNDSTASQHQNNNPKSAKQAYSQVDIQAMLAKFVDSDQISPDQHGNIDIQNFPTDVQDLIIEHLV